MTLNELRERLQSLDLENLDLNNAGSWPVSIKVLTLAVLFGVTLLLGYYLYLGPIQQRLGAVQQQQDKLKKEFELKAFQVANLEAHQQQMTAIETSFSTLLRQLPGDTEVPGLLEDISAAGRDSGLQLDSVQLQPEQEAEFYTELPFEIRVQGSYHQLGTFVSEVAALPRIVTLHGFSVTPDSKRGLLQMRINAKTYHYADQEAR